MAKNSSYKKSNSEKTYRKKFKNLSHVSEYKNYAVRHRQGSTFS